MKPALWLLLSSLFVSPALAQDADRAEDAALEADEKARSLSQKAADAGAEADATLARRTALAADVQQAERLATRLERRLTVLEARRRKERAALAAKQGEVARLLAALQSMSRRPAAAVLLAPEDAVDTARVNALVTAVRPELEARTKELNAALERTRLLRETVTKRQAQLDAAKATLETRIAALDREEAARRAAAADIGAEAEAARAKTRELAAKALELQGLTVEETEDLRPDRRLMSYRPSAAEVARVGYRSPAAGRVTRGFGFPNPVGVLERGVRVATRPRAVVTAPAPGTIAYAGEFRGYGRMVIIEHEGGMISLLSSLDSLSADVGDTVARGTPVGRTGKEAELYVELRRQGTPVDPMLYIRRGG